MDENFCDKVRNATLKQYSLGILDRQTIPQKIVNDILLDNQINYINEKTIGYYSVDNYLIDCNLIIEVMGDYFHSNPQIYNLEELNDMQNKDLNRDKRKHTYIQKYNSIEILYLWESDIKDRKDVCEQLILSYIANNGKLDDYNSFNFYLCNNKLQLKENKINPYFIITP